MLKEILEKINKKNEQSFHKSFVQSATQGCGVEYKFVKNDEERGDLDTNYIFIDHGKYRLVISISLPKKAEGISTYTSRIDFIPEDSKHPKIYYNAKSLDDAIKWVKKETGLDVDKSQIKS